MQFGMNIETLLMILYAGLALVACYIVILFVRELFLDENAERLKAVKKNTDEEERKLAELRKQHNNIAEFMSGLNNSISSLSKFGGELYGILQLQQPSPSPLQNMVVTTTSVKPKEEPEKPKVSSREKLNITRRGVDATRITVVSIRENWSDGSAKDYTCVQKCVSGPWFDATTGELLQDNNPVIKFLDYLVNSYDKELLEEQEPSPEDIFRGIVESLRIPKGLPYGQSVQLPKSYD